MKRIASVLALWCVVTTASAMGNDSRESHYTIYSKGFRVGNLKTVSTVMPGEGKRVVRFESDTKVKADLLVYSYTLDEKEETLVGEDGAFRYKRSTKEKDGLTHIDGRLEQGRFMFTVTGKGARRTVTVDRSRYDYTTMECPETTMKRPGDRMSLRLLDFEKLEVVTRTYHYVRNEDVTVGGKTISCKVIDFEDANKKCRRWVKADDLGVIIARQDGSGSGGSYSLRMTQLRQATHTSL
jgi:hypothetical protein